MWKILLEMPIHIQISFMLLSLVVGLWPVVIPFFILMNLIHGLYLFLTPWKPSKDYDDDDDDYFDE